MSMPLPRLVVHLASGQWQDVPATGEWLSAAELAVLAGLKLDKRRNDWRLGRWLARRAAFAALGGEAPELAIIAAPDGAPEVHGAGSAMALTISHSHGRGLAAAAAGTPRLGCDLELVEPRSERFVRDWLTGDESARIRSAAEDERPLLANLCWSAKEAASKVLRVGLRFDTRSFAVDLPAPGALAGTRTAAWQTISVTAVKSGESFEGVWRARAGFVETLLAETTFEVREWEGEREGEWKGERAQGTGTP